MKDEFLIFKQKKNRNKIKNFCLGLIFGSAGIILLSLWMFKQEDIARLSSFVMLWWGVSVALIAVGVLITQKIKE